MPRDGLILVRLPEARLAPLDHVEATYARDGEGGLVGRAAGAGGRYAIVLALKSEGQ